MATIRLKNESEKTEIKMTEKFVNCTLTKTEKITICLRCDSFFHKFTLATHQVSAANRPPEETFYFCDDCTNWFQQQVKGEDNPPGDGQNRRKE